MRAREFSSKAAIAEIGDSPAAHEPNRRRKRSLFHATVDGHWVDVFFDRSDLNGTLHITFTVNDNYEAPQVPSSASLSTIKILSTVLSIIKQRLPEYMRSARPPAVSFTAREDSRTRLYRKYFVPVVQDILGSRWELTEYPSMGMTVFNWRPVKKQSVEENFADGSDILYHATYRPLLKSIMSQGLGGSAAQAKWEDSQPGVTYLARDPEVARSYAETSDMVPEEWLDDIVILAIDASRLDSRKLRRDRNVQDDDSTLEYHGVIKDFTLTENFAAGWLGRNMPHLAGQEVDVVPEMR